MSRPIDEQTAIDALMELLKRTPTMAIRAKHTIEQLPTAEPEPCEDAVSRPAATAECFQSMVILNPEFCDELPYGEKRFNDGLRKAIEKIRELPPVTPKRKTGKWIYISDGIFEIAECDQCGRTMDSRANFCPNCGAEMRGDDA